MTSTIRYARTLWDFLSDGASYLNDSELIVVCGSYDVRVCDYACELLEKGIAPLMLITGKTGNWTRHLWSSTEAEVFYSRARSNGIRDDQLMVENKARNFAENIAFSRELFPTVRRATFVTKPNSILRVQNTLPIQWPELCAGVDAPPLAFPDDISNQVGVLGLIDEMVGDLHRLQHYPQLGFQTSLPIPNDVLQAWHELIHQGFSSHLLDYPIGKL
ncbi:YdcF family protein [Vreelandella zhaodongensis]|uniref:YdcF family protein n=1 Tax=Vreelandella zhaodongensis TaxID=1176240 RepID=A0ABX2STM6_VREZH|nr:YdcF family protein [Halomonas zhaodongensis]NYS44982.1 YdcF family protein [Halomonas zhaodongensis]